MAPGEEYPFPNGEGTGVGQYPFRENLTLFECILCFVGHIIRQFTRPTTIWLKESLQLSDSHEIFIVIKSLDINTGTLYVPGIGIFNIFAQTDLNNVKTCWVWEGHVPNVPTLWIRPCNRVLLSCP